jgi:hypothetical protein
MLHCARLRPGSGIAGNVRNLENEALTKPYVMASRRVNTN